jgi:phospholipid/cholesterol/gamma-HCH transport system ATP-binding protein
MSDCAIRFERVSKTLAGRAVLDDLSFEVASGRSLCLLGRSGTGKSVTLKLIARLMQPDRGCVRVLGQDLGGLDRPAVTSLRKRMGFLFQHAALFDSISVGENVEFPLRRHTDLPEAELVARSREMLARVGLEHQHDRMPGVLSGGMRKRAALARALVLEPELLLVDEPSAGLDPITSAEIDALLLDLRAESATTLIIVTHDVPSAQRLGDELAFLHEGRFIARGTPAALEHNGDPLVREFMRSQGAG